MDTVEDSVPSRQFCRTTKSTASRLTIKWRVDKFDSLVKNDLIVWSDGVVSPELPQAIWKLRIMPYGYGGRGKGYGSFFGIQLTGPMVTNKEEIHMIYQIYLMDESQSEEEKRIYLGGKKAASLPASYNPVEYYVYGNRLQPDEVRKALHSDGSLTVVAEMEIHHPELINVPDVEGRSGGGGGSPTTEMLKLGRLDMLAKLFHSGAHSDCSIVVGSESIRVHKGILAASSPVFSAMLDKASAYQEVKDAVVRIDDFQPEPVKAMLDYIYTGEIDWASYGGEVWQADVTRLADKYGLLELMAHMEGRLRIINTQQLVEVVQLADTANFPSLMKLCVVYAAAHHQEVLASPEWEEFESARPAMAMKLLKMGMKEMGEKQCQQSRV